MRRWPFTSGSGNRESRTESGGCPRAVNEDSCGIRNHDPRILDRHDGPVFRTERKLGSKVCCGPKIVSIHAHDGSIIMRSSISRYCAECACSIPYSRQQESATDLSSSSTGLANEWTVFSMAIVSASALGVDRAVLHSFLSSDASWRT
jgi:hypothetical protein